jgi:hypothetical protein
MAKMKEQRNTEQDQQEAMDLYMQSINAKLAILDMKK